MPDDIQGLQNLVWLLGLGVLGLARNPKNELKRSADAIQKRGPYRDSAAGTLCEGRAIDYLNKVASSAHRNLQSVNILNRCRCQKPRKCNTMKNEKSLRCDDGIYALLLLML